MEPRQIELVTEQILQIPKDLEFKTKRVVITWNEEEQEMTIRPLKRRWTPRRLGKSRRIPNQWENHVFPLTAKEQREIRRFKKKQI